MENLLIMSASPHVQSSLTTRRCMWYVMLALVPSLICSLYFFGIGAAIVVATSVVACVAIEYVITKYMLGGKPTISDGSAMLTGLLLAFNLPSNLPVWIVIIGAFVAIGIGKMTFGGLGCNIFNPALVGRVFLMLSFPVQMTSWPLPEVNRLTYIDAQTGATVLSAIKTGGVDADSIDLVDSAIGLAGGSLGEVGAIALIIGFIFLLATRVISWHIPVSIVGAVAVLSACLGLNIGVEILSGGLLLGAIFMATDYVTSPMSRRGMVLYGIMIGVITIIIRRWGAYPEGMSFAILLMNGCTPLINKLMKPKKFGERRTV